MISFLEQTLESLRLLTGQLERDGRKAVIGIDKHQAFDLLHAIESQAKEIERQIIINQP